MTTTPTQVESLLALLDTGTPIVVIETHEEAQVAELFEAVSRRSEREVWTWSVARGLRVAHGLKLKLLELGDEKGADANETKELPAALAQLERMKERAIVLLLDIHPYLSNPTITRACRELAMRCEARGLQLVFVGHDVDVPDELAPYASRFEVEPMTIERVKALFDAETARQRARSGRDVAGCRQTLQSLLRHMVGLPEASVRQLARFALSDGQINAGDLANVLSAKRRTLGAAELLVFEQNLPTLDDVAGMASLKRWLSVRRAPFLDPQASGLPAPRGVLLLGVQGAGKSLAAKAIAASWQVPLFRMDFGALFDKWQGESERKLRDALRTAEAMQPCVLWMDEIEKGVSSGGASDADSGAAQRMLGTLLTWMAERRGSVFLVATANDIERLPPELVRKGRFDEIFFVDLPGAATREGILRIHLAKHRIGVPAPALAELRDLCDGFSGAEIEAAIVAARYEAHATGKPADAAMLKAELQRTRPLSVTRAEAIATLRAWAAERTVGAD